MGIDLNHPDELDWMARGRRGEVKESLFTSRVSDQQLERETTTELLKLVFRRLIERDICDQPDIHDADEVDRVVTFAAQMMDEVGTERRETIEREEWSELDTDSNVEDFQTLFLKRVADRIIDSCIERDAVAGLDDATVEENVKSTADDLAGTYRA